MEFFVVVNFQPSCNTFHAAFLFFFSRDQSAAAFGVHTNYMSCFNSSNFPVDLDTTNSTEQQQMIMHKFPGWRCSGRDPLRLCGLCVLHIKY